MPQNNLYVTFSVIVAWFLGVRGHGSWSVKVSKYAYLSFTPLLSYSLPWAAWKKKGVDIYKATLNQRGL